MHPQSLTNVQLELVKLYSTDLKQRELLELKQLLANFFAQKAIKGANKIWDDKKLSNQDMETWLNEN